MPTEPPGRGSLQASQPPPEPEDDMVSKITGEAITAYFDPNLALNDDASFAPPAMPSLEQHDPTVSREALIESSAISPPPEPLSGTSPYSEPCRDIWEPIQKTSNEATVLGSVQEASMASISSDEPMLAIDSDVQLEKGGKRENRRRCTRRRCVVVAFGVLVVAVAGTAAWLGFGGAEDILETMLPPEPEDIERGSRPVNEHGEDGVEELRYIIGLDEEASEQAVMDLTLYLQQQGISYKHLEVLGALDALLTPETVKDLSSGRWTAVDSLERNMKASTNPADAVEGALRIDDIDDDEDMLASSGAPLRLLRFLSEKINVGTIFEPVQSTTSSVASSGRPYHLDNLDFSPNDNTYSSSFCGTGVDIYIVDTGVRRTHSEFQGRVGSAYYGDGSDGNGHGTAMAGAALGQLFGASNCAKVVDVQVLSASGSGTITSVIDGLNWIAANYDPSRPTVVSMSLGGSRSPALDNAVQNLVAMGIPTVVAAGNEGRDACNYSPAGVDEALTIGSIGSTHQVSYFSNTGSCVDLYTFGESIVTASHQSDNGLVSVSGTSPATALAAGVAAQFVNAGFQDSLFIAMVEGTRSANGVEHVLQIPAAPASSTTRGPAPPTSAPATPAPPIAATPAPSAPPTSAPTLAPTPSPTPPPTPAEGVFGDVSRSGRQRVYLSGETIQLKWRQKVQGVLKCTCSTERCNVDLYLMIYKRRRKKWKSVAVSRSRRPNEKLRARLWWPMKASVMFIAWPRRGSASCHLVSKKV